MLIAGLLVAVALYLLILDQLKVLIFRRFAIRLIGWGPGRRSGSFGQSYPPPIKVYDETIRVMKSAIQKTKPGRDEEMQALKRLDAQARLFRRANSGYVSLGIDHDTAQFAVNAARLWLDRMGRERYPATRKVMVTADCGGSNGPRLRLWKVELQRLADETGLTFQVCHYPPGTSKWNKIEHRMFCHITQNWRATPLTSRLAVVELIANTTTKAGLTIRCELDTNTYPKGIKVSEEQMAALNLKGDEFHPNWNYSISPRGQIVEP